MRGGPLRLVVGKAKVDFVAHGEIEGVHRRENVAEQGRFALRLPELILEDAVAERSGEFERGLRIARRQLGEESCQEIGRESCQGRVYRCGLTCWQVLPNQSNAVVGNAFDAQFYPSREIGEKRPLSIRKFLQRGHPREPRCKDANGPRPDFGRTIIFVRS